MYSLRMLIPPQDAGKYEGDHPEWNETIIETINRLPGLAPAGTPNLVACGLVFNSAATGKPIVVARRVRVLALPRASRQPARSGSPRRESEINIHRTGLAEAARFVFAE